MINANHPKMSPANARAFTDHYLLPDDGHYNMLQETEYEIKLLKDTMEYIAIYDDDIRELREATFNRLSFGDAVEMILKSHQNDYEGLTNDAGEEYDESVEKAPGGVFTKKVKKVIDSALYSTVELKTYYFLRVVGNH